VRIPSRWLAIGFSPTVEPNLLFVDDQLPPEKLRIIGTELPMHLIRRVDRNVLDVPGAGEFRAHTARVHHCRKDQEDDHQSSEADRKPAASHHPKARPIRHEGGPLRGEKDLLELRAYPTVSTMWLVPLNIARAST
jgi:hypothetical protein